MKTSFQAGCDTLYNKAKALGVTPSSNSPTDIANAMQSIYDNRYAVGKNAGTSAAKVGTAVASQVLAGYTFTNASTVGVTGTMPNNGAITGVNFVPISSAQSYTIPAGYHNGSGKVTCSAVSTQEKSVTPPDGNTVTVTPDAGKFLSKVTVVTSTCYNTGYNVGANAVYNNPNAYGLYTAAQYNAHYTEGYNAGAASKKITKYELRYAGVQQPGAISPLSNAWSVPFNLAGVVPNYTALTLWSNLIPHYTSRMKVNSGNRRAGEDVSFTWSYVAGTGVLTLQCNVHTGNVQNSPPVLIWYGTGAYNLETDGVPHCQVFVLT